MPERREQRLLHELIERPALLLLYHELHQVDPFAGVPERGARREVQVHLLVRLEHGEVASPEVCASSIRGVTVGQPRSRTSSEAVSR